MPELPEVETITRALTTHLLEHKITLIETHRDDLRYSLEPLKNPELLNKKIISVRRRARYIIIEMTTRHAFIIHLGMSGSLRVVTAKIKRLKHEHVVWHLDNGMTLRFNCPRRFGFVKVCTLPKGGAEPIELKDLGPEPLSSEFDAAYLYQATRRRSGSIKSLVMNNAVVVGVGNIYVTEALFKSGISPLCQAMSLTKKQCSELVAEIKRVLAHSIEIGGTTISDYKSVDGSEGKFVQHLKVYGNKQNCPVCGAPIKQKRLAGRNSYYCPKCQK
jgi:formamidopyrimidine-DNA glycosylase